MSYYAVAYKGLVKTYRKDGLNDATVDEYTLELLKLLKKQEIRGFAIMSTRTVE